MPYTCTVALILACLCVHLLLSVTEHYLFVLKSPEVRIADNKDEEECESNGGKWWDDMKSTTFPVVLLQGVFPICKLSFYIYLHDHTLELLPFNCMIIPTTVRSKNSTIHHSPSVAAQEVLFTVTNR